MSMLAMIVGIVLIGIGVFMVIPQAGAFGIFWTLIAIVVTGYHAINVFSNRGIAHEVVDFDTDSTRSTASSPQH